MLDWASIRQRKVEAFKAPAFDGFHSFGKGEGMPWWSKASCMKGKGKGGFKGKGKCCGTEQADGSSPDADQCWVFKPKKMLWLLSRLRSHGVLSGQMVAGIVTHFLPQLIKQVSTYAEIVDWKFHNIFHKIQSSLQAVLELAQQTAGLESCLDSLTSLAAGTVASASQALLHVLIAFNELDHTEKVTFIESMFDSQAQHLQEVLDHVDAWMPHWAANMHLEHAGIVCDGCEASPIKGPRFKSMTRDNYDLCGECRAKKAYILCDDWDDDKFSCSFFGSSPMFLQQPQAQGPASEVLNPFWQMKGALKGMFGSHKGKGKGKCNEQHVAFWSPMKGSFMKGKGKGCFKGKGKGHQEACFQDVAAELAVTPQSMSFPVVVEDGRELVIEWQAGEDALAVAQKFAAVHSISDEELPTIVEFVQQHAAVMANDAASATMIDPEPLAAVADLAADHICGDAKLAVSGGSKCAHPNCRFAVHSNSLVSQNYCCKRCEVCASQDPCAAPQHGGRCEGKICCQSNEILPAEESVKTPQQLKREAKVAEKAECKAAKAEAKAQTASEASTDTANEAQQPNAKTQKSPEEKQALKLAKQQEKEAKKAEKLERQAAKAAEKVAKQAEQAAKKEAKAAEKAAKAEEKAINSEEKEAKKLIEMIECQHSEAGKHEAKDSNQLHDSAAIESHIQDECLAQEKAADNAVVVQASQEPAVSEGALTLQEMGFGEAEELEGWVVACDGDVQKVVTTLTQ